jgi:hypothetical protein
MPTAGEGSSPKKGTSKTKGTFGRSKLHISNETLSPGPKYNVSNMDRLGREPLSMTMPKAERSTLIGKTNNCSY